MERSCRVVAPPGISVLDPGAELPLPRFCLFGIVYIAMVGWVQCAWLLLLLLKIEERWGVATKSAVCGGVCRYCDVQ